MSDTNVPVTVMARVVAQPGKEERVRDLLLGIVAASKSEAGNLAYRLVQSAENAAEFVTIERWDRADRLAGHMQQPYVTSAVAEAVPLLAAPPSIVTYHEIADPT